MYNENDFENIQCKKLLHILVSTSRFLSIALRVLSKQQI